MHRRRSRLRRQTYTSLPPQPAGAFPQSRHAGGLVALLLMLIGVASWFVQYNEKQKRLKGDAGPRGRRLVGKRDWNEALKKIEDIKTQAGSDLSRSRASTHLRSVQEEMTKELDSIRKLIDTGDFKESHKRLDRLPTTMRRM